MTPDSLQTASKYLNNLLLSRGLLQDGKIIDFAQPSNNDCGAEATMSRIINLVHDLVLRRDRDAEQREYLATSMRSLRVDEAQRVLDLQKVQDKNTELGRAVSNAEVQERALKMAVRKAETQVKELKEQMGKMKLNLDQMRAKCMSDVRKRDVELEKLKSHLTGLQRGKKEVSGMKVNVLNPRAHKTGRDRPGEQDLDSTDWSLEKETNELLATLVNETSTENVALRAIIQSAMDTLAGLIGLDSHMEEETGEDADTGLTGQSRKSIEEKSRSSQDIIVSCEKLATKMSVILEHCRSILKDPSFVPIEEVQLREEEINKLRIGWEKMAERWKEAVTMMNTFRRKMLDSNEDVSVEELSDLNFGRSIAVLPSGQPVLADDDEASSILFDTSRMSTTEYNGSKHIEINNYDEEQIDGEEAQSELDIPAPSPKRLAASPARRGIRLPRPVKAVPASNMSSSRKQLNTKRNLSLNNSTDSGLGSLDGTADESDTFSAISRTKLTRRRPKDTQKLSIPEKLAAIEIEATEAEATRVQQENSKRRAYSKASARAARRRSTLSPEELALLIGVS